jgi:hypothetical protein
MAFNIQDKLQSLTSTGPFTNAMKKQVWPSGNGSEGIVQDFDTAGKKFSIVDDPRLGGKCVRMKYPAGQYGMQDQSYQFLVKSPKSAVCIEYLWLAESNMVFNPYPNVGGGKIGPCIQWGILGGSNPDVRGTRFMWWYNAQGSNNSKPCFAPSAQDQASGNQYISGVYTKPLVKEQVYKFAIEAKGGPQGYAKYYQDGVLIGEVKPRSMKVDDNDDVWIDFAYFAGGASIEYAPKQDGYCRHGRIYAYSGVFQDKLSSSNGGGTNPTPPDPQPTPEGDSPYSLGVGETKIFQVRFVDNGQYPPKEFQAGGPVKWSLEPNCVSWGPGMDPMYQGIQVIGKTVTSGATLKAKDPVSGIESLPIKVDVTETPTTAETRTGTLSIVSLPPTQVMSASQTKFEDEPPTK